MPEQKMKITEEAFSDFTGHMCRAGFTNSISDEPLTERQQSQLSACLQAVPLSQSVNITPASPSVLVGKTVQLSAGISMGKSASSFTWKSANDQIATVNGTGLVTGVAPGKVKITATDQETQLSASVEVTVNPVAVQSVTVTPDSTSVEKGKSVSLKANVQPSNATNKAVTWSSKNEDKATVDQSGNVTGVEVGTATIEIVSQDGSKKATATVEVTAPVVAVTDIMFGWQKPIVEAAAEMERMRVMLRGLNKEKSNPGQAAADDMKYIVDMAQNAPFAMQALTDSFVKFRSAGLDPTDGSLKALVDSVARFGGDSELLKRAAVAVQQMSGKGVVSMEELRQQLGEAVPNAMQAMADAAGITMGELTKAVASGTVEAKQALSLMFVGLRAENENAAKDMMQTYTGALAQLQTSFTLFADRVGQAGYLDSLSKGMKELASIMNSAEGISFANSLGSGLTTAIDGLRQLAQWLAKNQELVINLGKVVAAMVAFKLMRAGIMGVVGAGSQMVSTFATMATAIQTPFNLGATAVTRFNRAARMGLAPIPSLIFAIRGAITGLKGAFAGLTAFIAANPIGAAFTV